MARWTVISSFTTKSINLVSSKTNLYYEKVFSDKLTVRGGIGWAPALDLFLDLHENDSIVPVILGTSYLFPIYEQYKIELGINISKDILNQWGSDHLTGILGYRFQPREQGIISKTISNTDNSSL